MALLSSGFMAFDVFFVFVAAIVAIVVYFKNSYKYWKKRGVPYLEPTFPYGNSQSILMRTTAIAGEAKDWYDELKRRGHKFGGVWTFSRKGLVLVDPDYIKDVLTKDFQYFIDRDFYSNEKFDPRGTHLFNIGGNRWKSLRQKLTPTFTAGKMKMMLNSVLECSDYMINYLEKCVQKNDDIDIREVFASFTTDVIGNVAFGLECNSFEGTQAEFREQGKKIFELNVFLVVRLLILKSFPELSKKIGVTASKSSTREFFANVVKSAMEYRKKNNVRRPDFLQLLIDMNEESEDSEKYLSFDQIVANTILFFIAGFDTSSTTMAFTLYELARNPEIQEKTRTEINNVLKKHDGQITYEALHEMTYLKQVIDEAMRIWPPLITLGRICTTEYKLRDTKITLEKGTPIVISTLGLGHDPEYFPEPEKFNPDRFTPEEKAKLHPYVHLPFGEGPRNCIGLRFGLMESKIGIVRVLTNFKISISSKTQMPLTIDKNLFLLKTNETLYLKGQKI